MSCFLCELHADMHIHVHQLLQWSIDDIRNSYYMYCMYIFYLDQYSAYNIKKDASAQM